MKFFLIFVSFFIMNSLYSSQCPEIDGSFECRAGSRVSFKNISPSMAGYLIESDGAIVEYIIDDTYRELPNTESMQDAKLKARCDKGSLVIDFEASILYQGSVIAKQVSNSVYEIKNGELQITQKTKMKGLPMPKLVFQCKRI